MVGLSKNECNLVYRPALHGGGWVVKTSKKSVTYFMAPYDKFKIFIYMTNRQ